MYTIVNKYITAGCEDDVSIPDYKTQKIEIYVALQQRLKAGDTWYQNNMHYSDRSDSSDIAYPGLTFFTIDLACETNELSQ